MLRVTSAVNRVVVGSSPAVRANKKIKALNMNKVIGYIKDSVEEVRTNVTWTATPELQKFTTIVVISLIVLTILVFIMDKISEFVLLDTIYKSL